MTDSAKTLHVSMPIWPIFHIKFLKSHKSVTTQQNVTKVWSIMAKVIQLHLGIKQLKIGNIMRD